MRVVCINDKIKMREGYVHPFIKGNLYTVLDSKIRNNEITEDKKYKLRDGLWYKFIEVSGWHHSVNFIPINETQKDETELLEQRQEQLQTV